MTINNNANTPENNANTQKNDEAILEDRLQASYMVAQRLADMRLQAQESVISDIFGVITQLTEEISALKNQLGSMQNGVQTQQQATLQLNPEQNNTQQSGALENLYSQLQLNNQLQAQ